MQAEAGAAVAALRRIVGLLEQLEQPGQLSAGMPGTGVGDAECELRRWIFSGYCTDSTTWPWSVN